MSDPLGFPEASDDGLLIPEVGSWALEKYRRLWYYLQIFSTGMRRRWSQRIYIDLFAGPGLARVRGVGRVVPASPMLSLRVQHPFTRYIFCEKDPESLEALRLRAERERSPSAVELISGDVNENVSEVAARLPTTGESHLSFCFVDPYSVGLHFETIQSLARGRNIDFLILLALGMDANRNLNVYLRSEHGRIERFLGDAGWRQRWRAAKERGETFTFFLATEYIEAMRRIGYTGTSTDSMFQVRSDTKNLGLYYLAFFSRNPLGHKFWREVLHYTDPQLGLAL